MKLASRTENAKRNIIWGIIQKCVALLFPFFVRTIIIKTIGEKYLGLSSLFTSILQVLNLTELGFSSAVIYCMYKPIAEGDEETISALMNYFRKVYRIIGICIFVSGMLLTPFLPYLIKGSWPEDINIYFLYMIYLWNTVLSYLLYGYKSALLLAHQRNDIDTKILTSTFLVQYSVQIVVLITTRNFYLYSVVFLLSTIISNVLRGHIVDRDFPQYKCAGTLSCEQRADIRRRVSGAFIQKICATTRNSADSILLSTFLGLTTVAVYGNYYYILTGIHGFLTVAITAITAGVGDSIARETVEKNHNDLNKFSFIYAWISGCCTVCMICLYQPFMELWVGKDLMFNFSTVVLLCIYFYSLTMGDIRSVYTTGAGLWWEGRYRSLAETFANIVMNVVLGYLFGVNGIIIATIVSILLINFLWGTTIVYKYYFEGISPLEYYMRHLFYASVTVIACALAYLASEQISIDGFFGMTIRAIIAVLVSNATYLVFYRKSKYYLEAKVFVKRIFKRKEDKRNVS